MDETISCLKAFPCCLCSTIQHPLRHGAERLSYFLLISHKERQQPLRYLFTTGQQEERGNEVEQGDYCVYCEQKIKREGTCRDSVTQLLPFNYCRVTVSPSSGAASGSPTTHGEVICDYNRRNASLGISYRPLTIQLTPQSHLVLVILQKS